MIREWLPIEAITSKLIENRFQQAVLAWSETWFTNLTLKPPKIDPVRGGLQAPHDDHWWLHRETVLISYSARALEYLIDAALRRPDGEANVSPQDRRLLELFEIKMMADLITRVEDELGIAGTAQVEPIRVFKPFASDGGLLVTISDEKIGAQVFLAAPLSSLAPLCWSRTKRQTRPALPPLVVTESLAAHQAKIDIILGEVDLTVETLSGLSVGDVVILDSTLDQGVRISARGVPIAQAKIARFDAHIELSVLPST